MSERREAALDVCAVLGAVLLAWAATRFVLYPALSIPANAPKILRPMSGFLVAWWLLRRRGQRWSSVGFREPRPWWIVPVGAAALYVSYLAYERFAAPAVAHWLPATPQGPSFFAALRGNAVRTALWLPVAVGVGGFMEELLFRGFLLRRVEQALGGSRGALLLGVLAQASLFASLHLYGGARAFVFAGTVAVVNAAVYLAAKRNLWPLVLAHVAWNAMGTWSAYAPS